MVARSRRKPTKEEAVSTTETVEATPEAQTEDQEPATGDTATEERRAAVTIDDALFIDDMVAAEIPKISRPRETEYKRCLYDDAMDKMWDAYVDAGSPHWSMTGGLTKADEPEGGWYKDRPGIALAVTVPNAEHALSLVRRAAKHKDISYRFSAERINPEDDNDLSARVYFAAAPKMKKDTREPDANEDAGAGDAGTATGTDAADDGSPDTDS